MVKHQGNPLSEPIISILEFRKIAALDSTTRSCSSEGLPEYIAVQSG